MKVLIATPLIDGRADREFINGLLQCHGLYTAWGCIEGQADISVARDTLATQFLATDFTTLVFIDGDIGFTRNDLQQLLAAPHAVASGLYPRKRADAEWVYTPLPGGTTDPSPTSAPFSVRQVGTGFLRIERRVLEDLVRSGAAPEFKNAIGERFYRFFGNGLVGEEYLSEDYAFCAAATRAGHSVFVVPSIRLSHVGRRIYVRN